MTLRVLSGLVLALASQAGAQSVPPSRGMPRPSALKATPVPTSELSQVLSSYTLEIDSMAFGYRFRVISAIGEPSGEDCECWTTRLYVARENETEAPKPTWRLGEFITPDRPRLEVVNDSLRLSFSYGRTTRRRAVFLVRPDTIVVWPGTR